MNISDHITWKEAVQTYTATRLGIDNTPSSEVLEKMITVANKVFEPVRNHFNKPIGIASFYRTLALNRAIKGAKNSQHMKGEAIDIDADILGRLTNKEIFDYIRIKLKFDQLIFEGIKDDGDAEWIHVSYKDETNNRNQILIGYWESFINEDGEKDKKMKYKLFNS